jgi:formate dehydrogenase iron-sulfur subunit
MLLNRRDFVKIAGAGVGAVMLGLTQTGKVFASSSARTPAGNKKAMLYDASKCIGCRSCETACKRINHLPAETSGETGDTPHELSAKTWTVIKSTEATENGEKVELYLKRQCMHCTEASCEAVCPTGAISHQGTAVVINQDWCIGCGYCVQACPFGVPHKSEEEGTSQKCILCVGRTTQGLMPACVEACASHAVVYADRATLVAEGNRRVQTLIANGMKNANLYGETGLGGLGVMYVLPESPSVYGLPDAPRLATTNAAFKWVSGIVAAGVVATVPFWLLFKREKGLKDKADKTPPKE